MVWRRWIQRNYRSRREVAPAAAPCQEAIVVSDIGGIGNSGLVTRGMRLAPWALTFYVWVRVLLRNFLDVPKITLFLSQPIQKASEM
jgi:hypothetical protein